MTIFERFIEKERQTEVENIRLRGKQIWPFLRVYVGSLMVFEKDRRIAPTGKTLFLIRYLFYGFKNWFGRYDTLVFTASNQRKLINGKYYDRCDYLPGKKLVIEQPVGKHFPSRKVGSEFVVSKMRFYLLEKLLKNFFLVGKIEHEDKLVEFIKDSKIEFDYRSRIRTFKAQYGIYKRFLKRKKPRQIYVVNSYINMAIVKAANDLNVEVVEFQHGVLNKTHYAYNIVKDLDSSYYPDYLLSFGYQEKKAFGRNNFFIDPKNVIPVGSFIIDQTNSDFKMDSKLDALKSGFEISVAFTSQDAYEDVIIPFLKKMAMLAPEILFVLIPRSGGEENYDLKEFKNIRFVNWLNTYQIIKNCDFHSTLTSTCAIEAPSLGIPNVLLDIEGKASAYYGETLQSCNHTFYGKSPEECVKLLKSINKTNQDIVISSNAENIIPNYITNIANWKS